MKLKNIRVGSRNTIVLPKAKINGRIKVNDVVFCILDDKIRFYAKVCKCSRSLAIIIPRTARNNVNLCGNNHLLSIKRLPISCSGSNRLVDNGVLNLQMFISMFHRKWLCADVGKNDMVVLYFRKGTRPTPIKTSKFIYLDEGFFEFLGLLEGELLKSRSFSGGFSFVFSNTTPEVISHITKHLEIFGIGKNELKYEIRTNIKLSKKRQNTIVEFWRTVLDLKNPVVRLQLYKDVNEERGLCVLIYNSTILAELLNSLLKNVRYLFENNDHLKSFLRGWAAADGSVHRKPGSLRIDAFQIAAKDLERLRLLSEILLKLRFKHSIAGQRQNLQGIRMHGFENFLKLLKMDVFKLHPERKRRFLSYLRNSQHVGRLRKLSQFRSGFTIQEFMKTTNANNYPPTYTTLLSFVRRGYLELSGEGKRNSPYIFTNSKYTNDAIDLLNRHDLI